ncbi:cytochrome-c peroxidase [Wenxinia marina]|uniref:Cytochrome c peroxidase n=1 Tax=Wenxinia marina DSM 24838 TaxID=1123501 RepID=A0A0D0Q7K2_9RHOB|nr:cytochrome c peroxidase [Wenxinia marina]KIQ70434.1 Cytochrome c peroxidase [Wenxinia marina DSM 24838]GGL53167.1 methylamine utilization protein MauG [Wenxinia marina]
MTMLRLALAGLTLAGAAAAEIAGLPAPVTDAAYRPVREDEARLGQLLFYDPILSGGREVACATCHHPAFGTSDGLSLGIGDGGIGLGPERVADPDNPPEERVPRNAQSLWNLGALEYVAMFHDGRIEADASRPGGLRTPIGGDMATGFASILSAQSMFPVVSPDEMAGHYSENEIAQAVRRGVVTGPDGAWALISARVAAVPEYARLFAEVYPDRGGEIAFTDISNALAAFIEFEFRSDTAPFDAYLRGEADLPAEAVAGLELFYGETGCASCHAGPFQTDHGFHAMGAPQIGPGKHARFESDHRDEGRAEVTGDPADRYAFRTPSLRNVTLTAPYGHAGAHRTLDGFLASHGRPGAWDRAEAVLPALAVEDWLALDDPAEGAAIASASVAGPELSEAEIAALVAFLGTLTDPVAEAGRLGIPAEVPSGLTVPMP